jgi:hypothetical protein
MQLLYRQLRDLSADNIPRRESVQYPDFAHYFCLAAVYYQPKFLHMKGRVSLLLPLQSQIVHTSDFQAVSLSLAFS